MKEYLISWGGDQGGNCPAVELRPTGQPRAAVPTCYILASRAAIDRNVMLRIRGPDVIGARADEAVVVKLLDYVRSPTADAGDRENRREHVHIDPQRVIGGGGIEIHVRVQFLF